MENVTPGVLQRLRAADIIRVAGLKVASLGQEYCRIGAVQQPQRHANRLVAFVHVPSTLDIPVEPAVSTTNHAKYLSAGESAESTQHLYTVEVTVESSTEWKRVCTCSALPDTFCSHAAALLYQWLAHPLTFLSSSNDDFHSSSIEGDHARPLLDGARSPETVQVAPASVPASVPSNNKPTLQAKGPVPFGTLHETLAQLGLSELRAIAREYEIATNGLSKTQLVEAILGMLRQPEVVRRMAALLEKPQRQLLAALALAGGAMLDDDLRGMFERFALGQPSQLQSVLVALQGKGLLLRTSFNTSSTPRIGLSGATLDVGWLVPPEVRNALRVTVPATTFDVQRPDEQGSVPTIQHAELSDLLALLLLVARKLDGYRLGREEVRDPYTASASVSGSAMRGAAARPSTSFTADGSLALSMPADTLSEAAFDWLHQELPYPLPLLRFAVRLLRLTDMLYKDDSGSPNLHVLSNAASLLLGAGYHDVARDLFELWLTQAPYDELIALQEDGVRVRCRATAMNYPLLRQGELNTENSEARQTAIALLAQAPLQQWLSFSSFARFLYRLNPLFLQNRQRLFSTPHWWLEREEGRPLRPLQLSDWLRAEYFYLARLLRGPLHWWGICDIAEGPDGRLLAFRLTPLAQWFFTGQHDGEEQPYTPVPAPETLLHMREPGVLLVESSMHARPLLTVLEDFAEVAGVEQGMLRYQLTPASLSNALGRGLQPTHLLTTLQTYGIEETTLAQYRRWIANFGRIRLYTNVALLETTDAVAMRELAATTSLDGHIVQTLHPTLHILKHAGVERMVDELRRRGQSPLLHDEELYGTE